MIHNGVAYAAKSVPEDRQGGRPTPTPEPAWGVSVRTLPLSSSTLYDDVLQRIMTPLLLMLLVNIAVAYVGITNFIKPLEDIAKSLKAKKTVEFSKLNPLGLYKNFLVQFAFFWGVTLACIFSIFLSVRQGMRVRERPCDDFLSRAHGRLATADSLHGGWRDRDPFEHKAGRDF
jgi:hypothetical protein